MSVAMTILPITIDKPKLPKGHTYILKTSQLVQALAEAKIACHINLIYWMPRPEGSILQALYWMPNANVPYRRVYIRAGSLLSQARHSAAELLQSHALPVLVQWLQYLTALPDSAPILYQGPSYDAVYTDGALQLSVTPQIP